MRKTFFNSSVTIMPSADNLVRATLASLFVFNWCSSDGKLVKMLQNFSILLKLCSTEFIKQVLPKFFRPSLFLGLKFFFFADFFFDCCCNSFFSGCLGFLGDEPPITGLLTARFARGRSARAGITAAVWHVVADCFWGDAGAMTAVDLLLEFSICKDDAVDLCCRTLLRSCWM